VLSSSPSLKTQSERSLAFKRWAQGRCYRCLARDHKLAPVATLFAAFAVDVLGIESGNADSCAPPLPRVPARLPPNLAFLNMVGAGKML